MEKRIMDMYNDAWKIYKEYLKNHNIATFTDDAAALCKKYGNETDICSLMIWWAARVNTLHQEYMKGR